jgi:gamma-glutamylcyclotransferase (GGCT)/AIG2-like uncharacterized protein YtfP
MNNYYFAYGSNMDADQMRERCPDSELVGVAILKNYKLGFTIYSPTRACGCADIVPSDSDSVYGLLYKLSDADLIALDTFEGHPVHYRRIAVVVETADGPVTAESYEVVDKKSDFATSERYLDLLVGAATRHGFPDEYQEMLLQVPKL